MRSRKGKGGQRGDDHSGRSESKNVAESPSAPAGVSLLWSFFLLLLAGGGIAGWYIQQQLQTIASLDQTIQALQNKLSQFEKIQAQVNELSQKLLTTEEYEQKLLNLEVAQSDSERKMDKTIAAVAQIQASDLESKLAFLQTEMSELRKNLLTKTELQNVENTVEHLRETEFPRTEQQIASVKSTNSKLEESVNSLSVSLSSLMDRITSLEHESQDLQAFQQSAEEMNAVKDFVDHNLPSLSNGVIALTKQLNQTTLLTDTIQSQVAQHSNELLGLKETVSAQQAEHLSNKEELQNIRELTFQLQEEKISVEELGNAVQSIVANDFSQLQNRDDKMDEMIANLQNHIIEVENNGINQSKQLADALDQAVHTVQKKLGKIETALKSTVEQCLSGEVRTYCETSDNCAWPHIREVNFPHRILKDPVIVLSLAEISSVDSIGVTAMAVDITDSGFKIKINNVGNYKLSTVRVNWMACA
ncbi:inhibitor of nuclear factor kappa-B kinase-interacting protein-like [Chiloscyllium plagiosum]|uniref:inhibitor of nuclear factor kappa-B kinase-interacting protein-like n=1 Tax=Chiloscyllium plagiosum TaxID=36176 RepID=UPI001CB7E81F|nr:inhibitor of nuclear factor kappa-B kinase-interacting protein-like [Chiloscyllium plagiosum]